LKNFWEDRRVLVTGHTGFKGSWISLWLQQLGAKVTGFALEPPTSPSLYEIAGVGEGMDSIQGDVRDINLLTDLMSKTQPEVIIHMAAQSLVRESYSEPVETYAVNVMGTVNVLEAARQTGGVSAIVNVTSDKCYENKEWPWAYRENEPLGGHDPYSSSKACAELVTAAYRNSFFTEATSAIASVRAGNVIGGGDWATDRLVPDIFRSLSTGNTVSIRNKNAIRPWQHVLEPVSGYLLLAEKLFANKSEFSESWNFGPDDQDARPVSWIVDEICSRWGHGACWESANANGPHEANYLKLDSSKSRNKLGWQPSLVLKDALEWTVDWYRTYQSKGDMSVYTREQINKYKDIISEK